MSARAEPSPAPAPENNGLRAIPDDQSDLPFEDRLNYDDNDDGYPLPSFTTASQPSSGSSLRSEDRQASPRTAESAVDSDSLGLSAVEDLDVKPIIHDDHPIAAQLLSINYSSEEEVEVVQIKEEDSDSDSIIIVSFTPAPAKSVKIVNKSRLIAWLTERLAPSSGVVAVAAATLSTTPTLAQRLDPTLDPKTKTHKKYRKRSKAGGVKKRARAAARAAAEAAEEG